MSGKLTLNLRTIARNAASVLASDVVNRAATFALYALVTRYLGLFHFGQFSLALTLFYTTQVLAVAGLRTLIIREVSRDHSKAAAYLINGSGVVALSTLLSMGLLLGFVRIMGYEASTAAVILLMSLALFPYALATICEALFQATEQMHYIAFANVPLNLAKVAGSFLLLADGRGIYPLVALVVVTQTVIAAVECWLIVRRIGRPRLRLSPGFALMAGRSAAPFLGIDVLIAMTTSMNIILVSRLRNESDVGLYSAPAQLLVPVMLLYQSVVYSVFPLMCRNFAPGFQSLKRIAERLVELLLVIGLPVIVGLSFLAERALVLLYGNQDFALAALVLRILVWELFLRAFTTALGQVLLAGQRERTTLGIVAVNALVSLGLGLILISQFGLIGAAVTAVAARAVGVAQHYVRVTSVAGAINLLRAIQRPAIASLCMAAYLAVIRPQNLILTVGSAAAVYAAVLLLSMAWSLGGVRQLKARYLYLWSE